jgi:hypothetical protein
MTKGGEREARWRRHVDAWRASGGTQTAYCKEHGLRSYSLSYWHLRFSGESGSSGTRGGGTLTLGSGGPGCRSRGVYTQSVAPQS